MTNQPFPNRFFDLDDGLPPQRLGVVIGGSLNDGMQVKLDGTVPIEGISVGSYVTIKGQTERTFFGLVTDIRLGAADPRLPPPDDDFRTQVYRGTVAYGVLHVKPMLVREGAAGKGEIKPVRSVPAHFTIAFRATPQEVQEIFAANEQASYRIGESLEDNIEIRLNLERFIERSSAVFGRSGTGKTFLALPLLASVIKQDLASVLIFDMHNDYGYTLKGDGGRKLKGLKQLNAISHKVVIVTLDEESSRQRGSRPEFALKIGYDQIEPEDLELLKSELSLSDVQSNALFTLKHRFPLDWLQKLMNDDVDEDIRQLFEGNKLTESTYFAIQRKVGRLLRELKFLSTESAGNHVARILDHIVRGESVVVEFGRYGDNLPAYIFVANFITRRIRDRYKAVKEAWEGGGGAEPKKLVIAIEEAHKFLEPGVAELTIFGIIARELRKYNVTLLIVDQRPSQIDAEVMSQIGTRVTCALSDEKDISAVFTGVSGAQQLRGVLAALDSKQQALIMGHAVPMPVVVKTAEYGEAIYAEYADGLASHTPEERKAINQKKLGRRDPDESLV